MGVFKLMAMGIEGQSATSRKAIVGGAIGKSRGTVAFLLLAAFGGCGFAQSLPANAGTPAEFITTNAAPATAHAQTAACRASASACATAAASGEGASALSL